METPISPPDAVRLALPAGQGKVFAKQGLGILALLICIMWMELNDIFWILPLMVMAMVVQEVVARVRVLRTPTYTLDEKGISFLDPKQHTPTLLAWADIDEVHSDKRGTISLSNRGRPIVVKISHLYPNYHDTIPLLLENLHPLWREMGREVYDKTGRAYLDFLISLVIFGGFALFILFIPKRDSFMMFLALGLIGFGVVSAYSHLTSVRRIRVIASGLEVTKVYGREIIPANTIVRIGVDPGQEGLLATPGQLRMQLSDNRVMSLDGPLHPILFYFILTVWQRDHLRKTSV